MKEMKVYFFKVGNEKSLGVYTVQIFSESEEEANEYARRYTQSQNEEWRIYLDDEDELLTYELVKTEDIEEGKIFSVYDEMGCWPYEEGGSY